VATSDGLVRHPLAGWVGDKRNIGWESGEATALASMLHNSPTIISQFLDYNSLIRTYNTNRSEPSDKPFRREQERLRNSTKTSLVIT
jgi:hypothetical protein